MDAREFFNLVKHQRQACKMFSYGRTAEEIKERRDEYYRLTDLIDAEIARVDKLMEKDNGKDSNDDTRQSAKQGELVQGD